MKKVILISLFFLTACASTDIRSSGDPRSNFTLPTKVVIIAANAELDERTAIESLFEKELDRTELEGISYLTLFPPEGKLTEQQTQKMLDDNGINGSLVVIKKHMFRTENFVSGNFYDLNIRSGFIDMPAPDSEDGYDMSKRVYKYKVSLLDRKQRLGWTADCVTEGTTDRSIYKSLAKTAVQKMIKDGIVEKNTGK